MGVRVQTERLLADEIRQAAAGHEKARAVELGQHLRSLLKNGVAENLSKAREGIPSGSAEEKAHAIRRFAAHVVPLLARGLVRPVLDASFALEDVRAAYERLESNATFGKVVLKV